MGRNHQDLIDDTKHPTKNTRSGVVRKNTHISRDTKSSHPVYSPSSRRLKVTLFQYPCSLHAGVVCPNTTPPVKPCQTPTTTHPLPPRTHPPRSNPVYPLPPPPQSPHAKEQKLKKRPFPEPPPHSSSRFSVPRAGTLSLATTAGASQCG